MIHHSLSKKAIVFGILFSLTCIGTNAVFGNNFQNVRYDTLNYDPVGAPLNNGYVDAFWKFDECDGDVLEDSSGHNYDGLIYESSWVSGKSNCALHFDGINDYIDLDTHSLDLGFNKTDDMIFSLWFRSSSANGGYIYCISGTQNVPEALIEICQNGSVHFKIWTSVCGIETYSDENHNDGEWHKIDIFYNGITAKPTMEIYIDGELEGSRTKWLCEVEDSDFNKAKIGRRAQTEQYFFNGHVDEFQIIKYQQGNDQDSPSVSGPTSGYTGIEYEFTFVSDDSENDELWYYIDWGDSTFDDWFGPYESGQEVYAKHKWIQDGTYEIKAKSKDYWDDSRWSEPHKIKIGNMNPEIPTISGPIIGGVGTLYEYFLFSTDPDGDDIYYYMDWDDGETSGWVGPYLSGETANLNHTWTSSGTYYIKAKAKDVFNDESAWNEDIIVTIIENDPPDTPTIEGPISGKARESYTYTFTSTDSDGDDVSYLIIWGDGDTNSWSSYQTSGTPYTESHIWDKSGKYIVKAKAKDIYGALSEWGEIEINIPRNRALYFYNLNRLFERYKIFQRFFI
jgi:hypothetical protein